MIRNRRRVLILSMRVYDKCVLYLSHFHMSCYFSCAATALVAMVA